MEPWSPFRTTFELNSVWKEFNRNGREVSYSSASDDSSSPGQDRFESIQATQQVRKEMGSYYASDRMRDVFITGNLEDRSPVGFSKKKVQMGRICTLCKTNGEKASVFMSHQLKDAYGHVVCPILSAYTCPLCGATGSRAHTINYCPLKGPGTMCIVKKLKSTRNSTGHKQM